MGAKSGFPLSEVLRSVLPLGDVKSIDIPSKIPLHLRIARKVGVVVGLKQPSVHSKRTCDLGSPWVTDCSRYVAKQAIAFLKSHPDSLCLLPAAEDQLCSDFVCAPNNIKSRIIACFHQPPGWFRLNCTQFGGLDSLGGIVCLGKEQSAFFRSVCKSPVHLIRHGVRHDFFRPPDSPLLRKGNRLLFVGQWLRDFETLCNTMDLVWRRRPDVRLDCVIPRFARNSEPLRRLAMDQRVRWHAELSDDQLRVLYQTSDLLFLPLLDAVANNAVVEALACGLPIVSTHVGGMLDYLPRGAGQLCQRGDVLSYSEVICDWLNEPARRETAGVVARNFATENLDWGVIGIKLYESIANPIHPSKTKFYFDP